MRKFRLVLVAAGLLGVTCAAAAAQERFAPVMTDERARQMLRAMDGDGNGVVSWEEFKGVVSPAESSDAVSQRALSAVEESSAGLFEKLDSNQDGRLDLNEIRTNFRLPYTIR